MTPTGDDGTRPLAGRLFPVVDKALSRVETVFYLIVAVFLVVAGIVVVGGTVVDFVHAVREGERLLLIALTLIEEALLLVIVGELIITLRLVLAGGELTGEPFLLVGLVATVRRIVVVTAELETTSATGEEFRAILLELGLLGALTVAFAVALFLLRRGSGHQPST